MPHADGSSIHKSRRIYVRPRTGPQSTHLWWPAVAKLQAASVRIAYAAAPWDIHTDGQTEGRTALSLNAPPHCGEHKKWTGIRVRRDARPRP